MGKEIVQMTPKFYLIFWSVMMGFTFLVGGALLWRVNTLISRTNDLITLVAKLIEKR